MLLANKNEVTATIITETTQRAPKLSALGSSQFRNNNIKDFWTANPITINVIKWIVDTVSKTLGKVAAKAIAISGPTG